jgi:hypothetical protein
VDPRNLTRRAFLALSSLIGLGAAAGLAGCGGGGDDREQKAAAADANAGATAEPCTDVADLSPDQVEIREAYEYVERAEAPAGGFCGGCTLMAGPIHPEASCSAFEEITT